MASKISTRKAKRFRRSYENKVSHKAENPANVTAAAVETINQSYEDKPDDTTTVTAALEIMKASMRSGYEDKASHKPENTANVTAAAVETINQRYEDKPDGTMIVTAAPEIMKPSMRSGDLGGQLLPGITDDITLNIILPRLSLADIHLLSSASPDWAEAVRSELVYKARVGTQSRETFVVFHHVKRLGHSAGLGSTQPRSLPGSRMVLSLYSTRDGSWYELPPTPGVDLIYFQCASLNGKIYILGGRSKPHSKRDWASKEVYVLDPAGARGWKLCANMLHPRHSFSARVMYEKIFVFGGTDYFDPHNDHRCDVYDPKVDAWSSIKSSPLPFPFNRSQVAALGEELILYGPDWYCVKGSIHPVEDKYRLMVPFGTKKPHPPLFAIKGAMMQGSRPTIFILDTDKQLWTYLSSSILPTIISYDFIQSPGRLVNSDEGFLRSRFGQDHTEIVWESIRPPHDCRDCSIPGPPLCYIVFRFEAPNLVAGFLGGQNFYFSNENLNAWEVALHFSQPSVCGLLNNDETMFGSASTLEAD